MKRTIIISSGIMLIILLLLTLIKFNKKIDDSKYLECLSSKLGGYILSEKTTLNEYSVDKIINDKSRIEYFKGIFTAEQNEFAIIKTNDSKVTKKLDNYFNDKYDNYFKNNMKSNIYVFIHNELNEVDFIDIENTCKKTNSYLN